MEKNNAGMTIIELVLASTLMILLSGIVSIMVAKSFLINRYSLEQGLNTTVIQNSLRTFSEYLREARQSDNGGYLIESGDDFEIVFYADVDNNLNPQVIERVHYFLDGDQLKMGISRPSGFPLAYPSYDEEVKIIGGGIINSPSQPIFHYYDRSYAGQGTGLATPIQPSEVSLIKIDLFVNTDPDNIPENFRMETFVRPRNIN